MSRANMKQVVWKLQILSAVNVCFCFQLGYLQIGGVKHMVYSGKNLIGRDASCCSVSVSSKVRLDFTVNIACHVLIHQLWYYWHFGYLPWRMGLPAVVEAEEWCVWTFNVVILCIGYTQGDTSVWMLKVKNWCEYKIVYEPLNSYAAGVLDCK